MSQEKDIFKNVTVKDIEIFYDTMLAEQVNTANKHLEIMKSQIRFGLKIVQDHYTTYAKCNHEWDGVLIKDVEGNQSKCKHCGEICYVAIGFKGFKDTI